MSKRILISALVLVVLGAASQLQAALNWTGINGNGEWNTGGNWDNGVPGSLDDVFINMGTEEDECEIQLPQSDFTINKLDISGDVELSAFGTHWLGITITNANGLTNNGNLEIWTDGWIRLDANVTNMTDAWLELEAVEVVGTFTNQTDATVEIWDEAEFDGGFNNYGTIEVDPFSEMWVEGTLYNNGLIQLYGSDTISEGTLDNDTGGTIKGFGMISGEMSFINSGEIMAEGGALVLYSDSFENTSTGVLSNQFVSSLQIESPADVDNLGTMYVRSGGGIAINNDLNNKPGGTIVLMGGTLAALSITQSSGATFSGFGTIATSGNLTIESGADIELSGPTNIVGNLKIAYGATLIISAGQTLITGHTTNNGTILLDGGTVLREGGYSGYGETANATPPFGGLVGHWQMDDDAASTLVEDSTGNDNDGTALQNTSGMSTSGVVGDALSFDGSNDYIDIGSNPIPSSGNWTLAGWVYCEGALGGTDDWATVFGSGSWTNGIKGVHLYVNSGNLRVALGDGTSYSDKVCISAITTTNANKWYHIVVVYDSSGTEAKVYVDGAYSLTINHVYAQSAVNFTIGRSLGLHTSTSFWYGKIDNVSIFNMALAEANIEEMYEEVAFLAGHWKLDDNAADTVVKDSSYKGNDGTAQQNTDGMSTSGKVGDALSFNGIDDYIDTGSNPIRSSTDWTLAGWVNCAGVVGGTDDWATVFGSGSWTSGIKGVHLYVNSGNLRVALGDGASYGDKVCVSAITTINAGEWYHVAVVYDSGNTEAKVYVDGAYSSTIDQAYDQSNVNFTIGNSLRLHASESYWYGKIDNVMIFNEALTDSQIQEVYNE